MERRCLAHQRMVWRRAPLLMLLQVLPSSTFYKRALPSLPGHGTQDSSHVPGSEAPQAGCCAAIPASSILRWVRPLGERTVPMGTSRSEGHHCLFQGENCPLQLEAALTWPCFDVVNPRQCANCPALHIMYITNMVKQPDKYWKYRRWSDPAYA